MYTHLFASCQGSLSIVSWLQVVFTDSLAQNLPTFSFRSNRIMSKSQILLTFLSAHYCSCHVLYQHLQFLPSPCTTSPIFHSKSRRCLTSKPAPAHHQITHHTTPPVIETACLVSGCGQVGSLLDRGTFSYFLHSRLRFAFASGCRIQ
jgi:hypothetical protein